MKRHHNNDERWEIITPLYEEEEIYLAKIMREYWWCCKECNVGFKPTVKDHACTILYRTISPSEKIRKMLVLLNKAEKR